MKFLTNMFPDQRPLCVSIAETYGFGEILDLLVEKAFTGGEEITDLRVIQAILLVASMRCQSNYCSVFHSLILNTLEVSPEEIEYIVTHHRFPDSLAEFREYDEFLTYAFFRKHLHVTDDHSYVARSPFRSDAPATRDLMTILVLSDVLLMLTVAFQDEVSVEAETFFATFPTNGHIGEYVKFFCAERAGAEADGAPTFSICMYCKDIENQKTQSWQGVEMLIADLPKNARFSHGICPPCAHDVELAS